MSKTQKETQTINIDGVPHDIESFTDEQKAVLNHITDLDRKISSSQFNLEQLRFGHSAFLNTLKESLVKKED